MDAMTERPAAEDPKARPAWEKPAYQRIDANEAETGIDKGPEILILLS